MFRFTPFLYESDWASRAHRKASEISPVRLECRPDVRGGQHGRAMELTHAAFDEPRRGSGRTKMKPKFAIALFWALETLAGCTLNLRDSLSGKQKEPSAAEHPVGVSAKQHFEAASAAMPRTDSDPAVAKRAREDVNQCVGDIRRLTGLYVHDDKAHADRPLYDMEREMFDTSEGRLTMSALYKRCIAMKAKLDTRKTLPTAAAHDPELERAFLRVVNSAYGTADGGRYVATILTSDGWQIQRHPDSGAVLGRARMAVFPTTKNSECGFATFVMAQGYVGTSFVGPYEIKGVGEGHAVECSAFPPEWMRAPEGQKE
jgi:hypothetical protein